MSNVNHQRHGHGHPGRGDQQDGRALTRLAVSATLHCLAGCAIGEVLGLVLATWWGWSNAPSIALAVALSILTMEIVDNAIVLAVPGAMEAGLNTLLFWGALAFSLAGAFVITVPVNRALIARGKGHAVVHQYHH
jgi:hypothetical protein